MPALESQLLASCTRHLKALARQDSTLSWRKRWGGPMTTAGDPDIYGCWRGHHFEMELKRPGQNPTRLQHHRAEEWRRAGASCFIIHSLSELAAAVDTLRQVVHNH